VNAIQKSREMQEQFARMGIDGTTDTPEQFAAWLARESDRWSILIKSAGIKAE
jgi:tripartite-type tricarboxylate transporter receptor subunit TctC